MEFESWKVDARPPELMERLVRPLLPPAVREEIMGDLCERYHSKTQYIMEGIQMLPFLIAGQVRRNTSLPIFGIQAFLLFFLFGGFVVSTDAAAIDVPRWLRAMVPALIVLLGLLLRDAYRRNGGRPATHAGIDLLIAILCLLASQALLIGLSANAIISPDWVLSSRRAFMLVAGLPMLFCLRLAANYRLPVAADEMSKVELHGEFHRFEKSVRWRNHAIAAAGLVAVCVAGPGLFLSATHLAGQIGWALSLAGGLLVIGYVFSRTSVKAMRAERSFSQARAFYRSELERQSKILRNVWWWYLLSIVPALAGGLIGQGGASSPSLGALHPVQLGGFALICVLVGWLYARYAHSFHSRFEALTMVQERAVG